ncbi:hypothetical protein BDK51DRAFT_34880 [Blyttiomyces helicus]|uniref:Uncharacterized protein n=1 Tax=Blyttiomyces helicus TaxID=388810 RepID=A0A4P9WCG8_9FUNG|nr:hypothetical protein BDK51DRAFT_34880 [Blyttiomyces helicus]|eukprot:RKO88908.1 hypothetical protein BDK51DRAFT_34880 [Blyttiomyces helicus]
MHITKIVSLILIAGAASAIGRPTYSDSDPIEVEDSQVATFSARSLLRHKSGLRYVSHLIPGHHLPNGCNSTDPNTGAASTDPNAGAATTDPNAGTDSTTTVDPNASVQSN